MDFSGFSVKEYQTLIAAFVALMAAGVAFWGVQRAANKNYKSAQDAANTNYKSAQNVAKTNIAWQQDQVVRAQNKRQAAVITWIYLRTAEARRKVQEATMTLDRFENYYAMEKRSGGAVTTED